MLKTRFAAFLSALTLSIALSFVGPAHAAGTTANISWTAPIAYNDGPPATALPASDIAFYTVSWGTNAGQSLQVTATSATVPVACGSANFTVTVTTTATAKYPNATSAPAGPVAYASGVTCAPKPVTGLQVS